MRKVDLGEVSRDLTPDLENENPRNSEGAFYTMENGEILYAYSRYKGLDNSDDAMTDICVLRSTDGGKSFGDDEIVLTCEGDDAVNMMSLSFLKMQDGSIGLFYLIRPDYTMLRMYLRKSCDGGRTWGKRRLCTPAEGYCVVNNDRVVRLSSGRIVIPAAWHPVCDGQFQPHADTVFFYSDDDGETWKQSASKYTIPAEWNCRAGMQEPGVIELEPGYLWAWARTDLGRQYELFSEDNGETWTEVRPSRFTSPCSPLSMKRALDDTIYAVWNPIPLYNGRDEDKTCFTGKRTPLVIAKSVDNGQTFSDPVTFEDEMDKGYCYCAIHFTEDCMLLAYCAGGPEDGSCLAKTRIRRVELAQLKKLV